VPDDPEIAGDHLLRRGRGEFHEKPVDAGVPEVELGAVDEVETGQAAAVQTPDQLTELLQRTLVPRRAEVARPHEHRREQRGGARRRGDTH
jgi:hypothetical protein